MSLNSLIKKKGVFNEFFDYNIGSFISRPIRHLLYITTKKCDSHCIMCNIWKECDHSKELNLLQWKKIIKHPVFSNLNTITFSGGEAFLRHDLVEIIKNSIKPKLLYIGIATNGLNPINIKKKVLEITNFLKNHSEIKLSIQISLDSASEIHSKVRGIPNAFLKVSKTIKYLKKIKKSFPNLYINFSCVMMKININSLNNLYRFTKKNDASIIFSPAISSKEYYKNNKINISLDSKSITKAIIFLENIIAKKNDPNIEYYKNVVIPILKGSKRKRRCMMGINSMTIEEDGSVPFCINAEKWTSGKILKNPNHNWKSIHRLKKNKNLSETCLKCPAACGYGGVTFSQILKIINE